jgi:NAD(P)H-dependent flavin oxidoreductase YrpB (nitropropane dioxygenase family)
MAIRTRLTEALGISAPILSAPMGLTSGGKMAAAVSAAGGLGFLGASAGDPAWIDREFRGRRHCPSRLWLHYVADGQEARDARSRARAFPSRPIIVLW